jgi:hypothetical protein
MGMFYSASAMEVASVVVALPKSFLKVPEVSSKYLCELV